MGIMGVLRRDRSHGVVGVKFTASAGDLRCADLRPFLAFKVDLTSFRLERRLYIGFSNIGFKALGLLCYDFYTTWRVSGHGSENYSTAQGLGLGVRGT